jgi:hypothetical protein
MGQRLRRNQSSALHDLPDRARRRPRPPRLVPLQYPLKLPRAPAHVRCSQLHHGPLHIRRRLVGMAPRSPVQFHQPARTLLTIPPQPYVPGFPRHPKPAAQIPHRPLFALIVIHKAQLLFHRTARSPGHQAVLNPARPRCSVSNPPGSICQPSPRSIPKRLSSPLAPKLPVTHSLRWRYSFAPSGKAVMFRPI